MKNKSFLLGILSSLLFLLACKSGPSGEAYVLKMRLNESDSFNHNMKVKMDTKVTGQDMKMDMDMGISFYVMENKNEEKKLRLTYTKMKMKMDMANMGVNTDSLMNKNQNKIVGKSIQISLSPSNEITDVSGFDSLMVKEMYEPETRQLMEKSFSKEQLNSMFGMMFSVYPSKAVRVGETWKAKTKFNMANIDMNITIIYKLLSVKDGIAEINVDGKIDGDGKMNQAGMDLSLAMKGTQKGKLWIKLIDGYLKTGFYDMDMTADMEVLGQKIPMSIKANYEMSGE